MLPSKQDKVFTFTVTLHLAIEGGASVTSGEQFTYDLNRVRQYAADYKEQFEHDAASKSHAFHSLKVERVSVTVML